MPSQKKKCVSRSVPPPKLPPSNANDNQNAIFGQSPMWSNLPANVLREIFQCSAFADRLSMGQVCKSWYQGFRDPVLWRKKIIEFSGGRTKLEIKYDDFHRYETDFPIVNGKGAIKFVKVFPTSLQDVEIIFLRFSEPAPKEDARDFKTFASSLDQATLRNLIISSLKLDREKRLTRADLIDSVERLLQNQRSLRICHIVNACFDLDNGIKVLKCLADSSGTVIENLSLKKYFRKGMQIYREGRVVTELQRFKSIVRIYLDYDTVSNELVHLWSRDCPNLSFITLSAKRAVPRSNVVTCDAWRALVGSHPNVLVDLQASKIQNTRETLPILSPAMPVYELGWGAWMGVITSELELTNLLHRVASYHRTIKVLDLFLDGDFPNLDPISVKNMLSNCKNLLTFTCEYDPPDSEFMEPGFWRLSTEFVFDTS